MTDIESMTFALRQAGIVHKVYHDPTERMDEPQGGVVAWLCAEWETQAMYALSTETKQGLADCNLYFLYDKDGKFVVSGIE